MPVEHLSHAPRFNLSPNLFQKSSQLPRFLQALWCVITFVAVSTSTVLALVLYYVLRTISTRVRRSTHGNLKRKSRAVGKYYAYVRRARSELFQRILIVVCWLVLGDSTRVSDTYSCLQVGLSWQEE